MQIGPVLARELLTAGRNSRVFRRRAGLAACVLLSIGLNYFMWSLQVDLSRFTIAQGAAFAGSTFWSIVFVQIVLTLVFVPTIVGRAIAEERERSTLDELLMTRLSSFELVVEKVAAGLLQYASCLATTLPITIILPILGGVDPRLVLIGFVGTLTTAFFLAALSILVSLGSRSTAQAFRNSFSLGALWLLVPFVAELTLPMISRLAYVWLSPLDDWLLASSPGVFLLGTIRWPGPGWFPRATAWMIGLQLTGGSLLIGLAVARLRPACRDLKGGDGRILNVRRPRLRWRPWPRPACGDNPVLWREMFAMGPSGMARVVSVLVCMALYAIGGYVTYRYAAPLINARFSSAGSGVIDPGPAIEFNMGIRQVTSWGEFFLLLTVAGLAAEGVAAEKTRDTWIGLIATPLEGPSILHAKILGAIWRVRWGMLPLVALWLVGVAAAAIHPAGFILATCGMAASVWFFAAFGTYVSLVSRDSAQASTRTLITTLVILAFFLVSLIPFRPTTIVLGAVSMPFVNFLALFTPGKLQSALSNMSFVLPGRGRIPHGELTVRVVAALSLGIIGHVAGAIFWTRAAIARFDEAVGRPRRKTKLQGDPGNSSEPLAGNNSLALSVTQ